MLAEMRISGLGVIDDASIELDPGLTVVTGETGAGKTMLVSGLHLLSGGRADAARVRSDAAKSVVEGRFELGEHAAATAVAVDAGAEPDDDGSMIAVRTVGSDGRSRAHLGGRSVPVGVLAALSDQLIAVHGQNDQLRLLRPAEQRAALDAYSGDAFARLLADYHAVRKDWLDAVAALRDRTERSRELAREADLLRHGLAEINAVDPVAGEDAELVVETRRLTGTEDLREHAGSAHRALHGADDGDADAPGASSLIEQARRELADVEDPSLRALAPRIAEAATLLTDVQADLSGYLSSLDADPARLEWVLARQAELKALTRKYAADVDGVLDWAARAAGKLAGLDTSEEAVAELTATRDELAAKLGKLAAELSRRRSAAADTLAEAITAELH
ncbi:MAG: AAA family ATPase, partial [Sciscionella sp.]